MAISSDDGMRKYRNLRIKFLDKRILNMSSCPQGPLRGRPKAEGSRPTGVLTYFWPGGVFHCEDEIPPFGRNDMEGVSF
jgi:hypothetical protein